MRWTSIDSQARISPVCGQPKTDLLKKMPVPSQNFIHLRKLIDFPDPTAPGIIKFSQANELLRREKGYHTCPLGAAVAAAHSPFPAPHSVVAAHGPVAAERDNKKDFEP